MPTGKSKMLEQVMLWLFFGGDRLIRTRISFGAALFAAGKSKLAANPQYQF
jgi:hypothetical protein